MNRAVLLVLVLFTAFTSCTVYKEYPIEVFKPGEVAISPDANNVALIYRNFKFKGDTLQDFYKENNQLRKVKTPNPNQDSILVSSSLKELAANLKSRNTFNDVKILPYSLFKPHAGEKLPALNQDIIGKIAESTNSDIVISLETLSYFFSKKSGSYGGDNSNEVVTVAAWAVYNPAENKLIERKSMIDTIFWNNYDNEGNYKRNSKLPPRETALKIAAQLAGENYAKRFFASWQTVNRIYSIPPLPDFSDAANYVSEGKWDDAINLWMKYADRKDGRIAINARYNLALGYEMKDDIETASKWLDAAQKLAIDYRSKEDIKRIFAYQKVLQKRKADLIRLNEN